MKIIRLQPSGKDLAVDEGDTVLATLERHGYALPNNCRAGACGECRCKVLSGTFDQGLVMDMALGEEDRAAGYGLMCMAKPISDVLEIEFGTADGQPKLFPPRENVYCVVTDKIARTPSIVELRLRPLGEPLRYWPGQYVTLGDKSRGRPERCYSIAGIPNRENEIVLQVTRVEGGATSMWIHDELKAGQTVAINGPYGTFIGDPAADTPVLCLASGSGLAPITSLASAAFLRGGFRQPATILFSARTRADVYEEGLFAYLKARFRNFDFKYTLTGEPNPGGLSGRIPALLPTLYPDLSRHSVYIAGSPGFVEDCTAAVRALGLPEDRLHTEGFYSQVIPETPNQERLIAS
ncbi:2Fe-2S iron-sulfur cluster-binding protein [Caenispirillum bisanense]|uniref:CDP-4-dehydro-6-deoxyglucose reductase n=1 Tax=Caenispirillum bisanense TaxID=414052 RepID=A0A286H0G6_9PROT|nr:2Fe-2S iron-sulfur cluster-binding protein [Caenispirillum bisanense]SOE00839.1 CDP-4-dehydro-6-deoxyglucose reductase [Caenispirillum bisanense]